MVGTSNKPVPEMAIEYWSLPNKKKPCRTDIQVIGSFFSGQGTTSKPEISPKTMGFLPNHWGPDFGSPKM